jgi:succinoglycan biosynthesis protein ExoO
MKDQAMTCGQPIGPAPRVSVIMPVFNGDDLLGRAIDSVRAQTESSWEAIVVDDGSTDGTWQVIQAYAQRDPRVRGFRHTVSTWKPIACNDAMSAARGQWIAVLDHDDWYDRARLHTLLDLAERERANIVADNQWLYDAGAETVVASAFPGTEGFRHLSLHMYLRSSITGKSCFDFGMLKPIVSRELLERENVRYIPECRNGHDFHFLLDCLVTGAKAVLWEQPMYFYSVPFGPISRQPQHLGKRVLNYQQMRAFNDMAVEQYRNQLSKGDLYLLRRRGRHMTDYARYLRGVTVIAQKSIAALLLGDPRTWRFIVRTIARRFSRPAELRVSRA